MIGEIAQLITAIAALGAFLVSLRNMFIIKEVKHATNSMMDQRLAETRVSSEAKGELHGRALQKSENK